MSNSEKNILVVDDEEGFHELFRFLLEPMGFVVHSAHDGLEGLEQIKARDYGVIFLDVHMPKMKGPELLKLVKGLKPAQFVVIMSSGSDPKQIFEKTVKDIGAAACMFKPFELDQIMENIRHIPRGEENHG
jgi:DNA-binding NtrC family response regulator